MATIDKFAHQVDTGKFIDYRKEIVPGVLWGTRTKKVPFERQAKDDEEVQRYFHYRAPLLRVLFSNGRYALFNAILDGTSAGDFSASETTFRIAPEELAETAGKPVADIWFRSHGKRNGPFNFMSYYKAVFTFASKEQMDEYLDTGRRLPKGFRFKGTEYSRSSDGTYQSSDGSVLPWLVVAYLMLSGNERNSFAAQNPELQQHLAPDPSQTNDSGSDQDQGTLDSSDTDGPADTDSNSDSNDGATDGGDSGGDVGGGDAGGDGGGGGGD